MKKILQKDALILRKTAESVPVESIRSPKIQTILEEMKEALASQDDGVAIAAPQIGYPLRIFIISKKVEGIIREAKINKMQSKISPEKSAEEGEDIIFINPVIKKVSKEKKLVEEGCLSVRYLYGKVSRGVKATVEAYDEKGRKFERGGTGLMSQIFQHETDHLDGVLFIDKAEEIEEILPEKQKKLEKMKK